PTAGKWDEHKNRLPASEIGWEGRLKADANNGNKKIPYDFEKEVIDFKTFDPVGGGIHFGVKGEYKGPPLSKYTLRYDLHRQELILTGQMVDRKTPPPVYRLTHIRPEVVKPLFQFVSAGRNAAISIGWGTERSTSLFGASAEQPILLDPFLVDTPV